MRRKWLALVIAAAFLPAAATAQDDFFAIEGVDDEEDVEYFLSEIEVGVGYLDDDAFRFGKFSGLTDKGAHPLLDFSINSFPAWDGDDTSYWRFEGRRVGLDTRRLELEFGQQGTQRVRMGYREMHNNTLGDGMTPFRGIGSASLTLPGNWEATAASTGAMPVLEASLVPVDVGHRRQRLALDYRRNLDPQWTADAAYRREIKDGTRVVGAAFGSTGGNPRAAAIPAPVDFVTDIFDLTLQYSGERYLAGFSYHGSLFDNREDAFSWRNPYGQLGQWAPGVGFPDGHGRMALEPSNQFHQLRAFGASSFGATSRVSADLAVGRMTQDEPFLPYTINPLLEVTEPLPRTSLDGRIDTTVFNLRMTSRPMERLTVNAGYRFDDRDNRTPQALYQYVRGDSQHQPAATSGRINLPYSLKEHRIDLSGTYRFAGRTRLTGGYQLRDVDRTFSESSAYTESTLRAGLRLQPSAMTALSIDLRRSERDADRYDGRVPLVAGHLPGTVGPDDFENHPLLRKYYLTDRDRDQASVRADLMTEGAFSLGLMASHAQDRYDDRFFGLNRGEARSVTVDGGYHPTQELSLSAWFTRDSLDALQTGRAFAPGQHEDAERDWRVTHDDRVDSFGVNLQRAIGRSMELGTDLVYSRTRSTIGVDGGSALNTAPFPDLVTKLTAYSLYLRYHLNAASSLRFGVEHERYAASDFALDGVAPDTMANVLWLASPIPNYQVNWITMTYRYRF